jgi:hypothetical protein
MKQTGTSGRRIRVGICVVFALLLLAGCGREDHAETDSGGTILSAHQSTAEAAPDSAGSASAAGDDAAAKNTGVSEPMPPADRLPEKPEESAEENRYIGDDPEQAQAGVLTAGEWDDLRRWDWWRRLMNEERWSGYQEHWGFRTYDRIYLQVRFGDQPAADAAVTLLDGQGAEVWTARTNQQGEAYLFADMFGEGKETEGYSVVVRSGERQVRLKDLKFNTDDPLLVMLEDAEPDADLLDLMLMIDTTGSMGDELAYLQAELKHVIGQVRQRSGNLRVRVSANFYRDYKDEYVVKTFPFTENIDKAVRQLSQQSADGGGDYEEAVEEALEQAIREHEWSKRAKARLLLLVLDAPPRHTDSILSRIHSVTKEAAAAGIRIIPIASSGVNKETEFLLRLLSIATGGTYVFLTDDSGVGNPHLEPTVGEYEVRMLNDLLVEIISRYAGAAPESEDMQHMSEHK